MYFSRLVSKKAAKSRLFRVLLLCWRKYTIFWSEKQMPFSIRLHLGRNVRMAYRC